MSHKIEVIVALHRLIVVVGVFDVHQVFIPAFWVGFPVVSLEPVLNILVGEGLLLIARPLLSGFLRIDSPNRDILILSSGWLMATASRGLHSHTTA